MENTPHQELGNKWLSVPIIATITRLLCRELTLQNEYLLRENKILKSKINKRITFDRDNGGMYVVLAGLAEATKTLHRRAYIQHF